MLLLFLKPVYMFHFYVGFPCTKRIDSYWSNQPNLQFEIPSELLNELLTTKVFTSKLNIFGRALTLGMKAMETSQYVHALSDNIRVFHSFHKVGRNGIVGIKGFNNSEKRYLQRGLT